MENVPRDVATEGLIRPARVFANALSCLCAVAYVSTLDVKTFFSHTHCAILRKSNLLYLPNRCARNRAAWLQDYGQNWIQANLICRDTLIEAEELYLQNCFEDFQ